MSAWYHHAFVEVRCIRLRGVYVCAHTGAELSV